MEHVLTELTEISKSLNEEGLSSEVDQTIEYFSRLNDLTLSKEAGIKELWNDMVSGIKWFFSAGREAYKAYSDFMQNPNDYTAAHQFGSTARAFLNEANSNYNKLSNEAQKAGNTDMMNILKGMRQHLSNLERYLVWFEKETNDGSGPYTKLPAPNSLEQGRMREKLRGIEDILNALIQYSRDPEKAIPAEPAQEAPTYEDFTLEDVKKKVNQVIQEVRIIIKKWQDGGYADSASFMNDLGSKLRDVRAHMDANKGNDEVFDYWESVYESIYEQYYLRYKEELASGEALKEQETEFVTFLKNINPSTWEDFWNTNGSVPPVQKQFRELYNHADGFKVLLDAYNDSSDVDHSKPAGANWTAIEKLIKDYIIGLTQSISFAGAQDVALGSDGFQSAYNAYSNVNKLSRIEATIDKLLRVFDPATDEDMYDGLNELKVRIEHTKNAMRQVFNDLEDEIKNP